MTPEGFIRDQLAAAQRENDHLRGEIADAVRLLKPVLAMAAAYRHYPDTETVAVKAVRDTGSQTKLVSLDVRDLREIEGWATRNGEK